MKGFKTGFARSAVAVIDCLKYASILTRSIRPLVTQ